MYGKIFAQMYEGTLASKGPWQALVTFQQMIVLANKHGEVDMTPEAIAARTTIPLDIIKTGIAALEQPDPYSRTPGEEGRRIVLLDEHRPWGWRIVNYTKYRQIQSSEDRREYFRLQKQKQRAAKADKVEMSTMSTMSTDVHTGPHGSTEVTEAVSSKHIREESEAVASDEQPSNPTPRKEPSAEGIELARLLRRLILRNNPKAKTTDDQERSWAIEADRMLRLDGRTPAEVRKVIEFSQRDSFWLKNILSMGTLREKFDKLWVTVHGAAKQTPTPKHRPELDDAGRAEYARYGVSA